jgi:hypothetical protein
VHSSTLPESVKALLATYLINGNALRK